MLEWLVLTVGAKNNLYKKCQIPKYTKDETTLQENLKEPNNMTKIRKSKSR